MIDKVTALKYVLRFSKLDYFPSDSSGFVGDLAAAMIESHNEVVAEAVVKDWLRDNRQRPTPADLYRLVGEHNAAAAENQRKALPDCPVCEGVGQRVATKIYRGEEVTFAFRCDVCGGSGKVRRKVIA